MLQSKKLSKKYQDKLILDDITLEIPQAQVTAFIGANGAGKSTLLGIMSRLITKEDGEVLIDDQDVTKWKSRALAQKLAILKQSNQVSARLTVEDLVAFGRFPYSKGRLTLEDQQKVTQALEYMEITDLKADYIDELSGGQQQRVYRDDYCSRYGVCFVGRAFEQFRYEACSTDDENFTSFGR